VIAIINNAGLTVMLFPKSNEAGIRKVTWGDILDSAQQSLMAKYSTDYYCTARAKMQRQRRHELARSQMKQLAIFNGF